MATTTPTGPDVPTTSRSPLWHNVAIRLADEGVPVRAIVRTLLMPYEEVREVLGGARERGMILSVPHDDWPVGTRRDERQPDTLPLELEDDHMVMLAGRTFQFTPSMARLFVALLRRTSMSKSSLHLVTLRDDGGLFPHRGKEPSEIRIVDVFICKMRKRLKSTGVKIDTMWGAGYLIPTASKEIAFRMMGIKPDTLVVPAKPN